MSLQDFLNIEFAGEDLTKIADPDLVPEGTHTFEILQGYAPKETKSGGVGLSIGCREVTGKGIVNLWINLRHPNPTVVKIGKETLTLRINAGEIGSLTSKNSLKQRHKISFVN